MGMIEGIMQIPVKDSGKTLMMPIFTHITTMMLNNLLVQASLGALAASWSMLLPIND